MDFQALTTSFSGKKILITGNNGFKGSWLSLMLSMAGGKIYGFTNNHTSSSVYNASGHTVQFIGDIGKLSDIEKVIRNVQPDYIFSLAAQPLTLSAYEIPHETFVTNAIGALNVMESVRLLDKPCKVVIVTSDKCYKNNEWIWGYRENDILAGIDPYSASKSAAEIIINSYIQSFFKFNKNIKISSCRAGNAIGGGDWSPNRIIPDCLRAWSEKKPVEIRSPHAVRPWNYVLDVLYGYILVAMNLDRANVNGEAFNFGPPSGNEVSVHQLVRLLWDTYEDKSFEPITIKSECSEYFEHTYLKLNCDKSRSVLDWQPKLNVQEIINATSSWYLRYSTHKQDMTEISKQLIQQYFSL